MLQGRPLRLYASLAMGLAAVSAAAILIRLAGAPALVVALYRLGLASAVLLPLALVRSGRTYRSWGREEWRWCAVAAASLAAHFGFWIASLEHTSVASSVVLVTSSPVLVALASPAFTGDRVTRREAAGVLLGLVGGLVIAGGDLAVSGEALAGDLLAFLGAVGITGYYLAGRRLRPRVPLLPYVGVVYSGAALLLLVAVAAARLPLLGYPATTYSWLAVVALVPQLIGHSFLNWALAHFTPTVVAVTLTAEPVVASVLALLVLEELPPWTTGPGGLMVLAGVYLAWSRGPGEALGAAQRGL